MAKTVNFLRLHHKFRYSVLLMSVMVMVLQFLGFSPLMAQDQTSTTSEKLRPVVTLNLGMHGIGLGVSRPINKHWSIELGYTYMEAGAEFTADLLGFRFVNSPYLKSHMVNGTGRFSIRPNGRFNIAAGITWMDWNMEYGIANANDLKLGNVVFTKDELGQAKLNSSNTWSIAPYLGIHLGRANPKTRVSMAMDFGFFYTNGQYLQTSGTGLSSAINIEEPTLRENFSTYKVLPQFNFQIRCKL